MILHTFYQDKNHNIVYLDSFNAPNGVFYKIGRELVHSTVDFFTSKYSLIK